MEYADYIPNFAENELNLRRKLINGIRTIVTNTANQVSFSTIYSNYSSRSRGPRGHPPSPVKISHKKDGRQRQPHSIHFMFLGPSYQAAGSTNELVSEGSRISQKGCQPPKGRQPRSIVRPKIPENHMKMKKKLGRVCVGGGGRSWCPKLVGHLT